MSRRYPDAPLVGVGVVILDGDRVVMCRRSKPPRAGGWSLPGGGQELGETVREAAIREAREETGIDIDILGIVDVIDSLNHDDEGRVEYHYALIDFAARVAGGRLTAGDDATEAEWFTLEEVRRLDTWETTIAVIEQAFARFGGDQS